MYEYKDQLKPKRGPQKDQSNRHTIKKNGEGSYLERDEATILFPVAQRKIEIICNAEDNGELTKTDDGYYDQNNMQYFTQEDEEVFEVSD
jgi:hypothetical protein